jgi:hypothetical protein
MPKHVNLPSERVKQLETLAEKWEMSVADVIGRLIHEQIEKGELSPDVPGVTVKRKGNAFSFSTPDFQFKFDREEYLISASQKIRQVISPSPDNPLMPLPKGFGVVRRGTSLKLQDKRSGAETTFAPSVAEDVAAMMERTIKSA